MSDTKKAHKPRHATKARAPRPAACGCVRPESEGHTSVCSIYGAALARTERAS